VEELLNQADDIELLEEDEDLRRQVRGKQWQEKQRNKLVAKDIQVPSYGRPFVIMRTTTISRS
jgi:hypothetical protein